MSTRGTSQTGTNGLPTRGRVAERTRTNSEDIEDLEREIASLENMMREKWETAVWWGMRFAVVHIAALLGIISTLLTIALQ
jgi:hypothetical protein